MRLTKADCQRLDRIAATMDTEAQTWMDGHGAYDEKTGWSMPKDADNIAQVRHFQLTSGAKFLRTLALKHSVEDYSI